MTKSTKIVRVGTHRGNSRIWFEGKWLAAAGFAPGWPMTVKYNKGTVIVTADKDGTRKISGKRKGDVTVPVIDLVSDALTTVMDGAETANVRILNCRLVIVPITS